MLALNMRALPLTGIGNSTSVNHADLLQSGF